VDTSYLIEIRMFGKAKHEIRDLVLQTSRQFDIQITRPVPHITLVGGFTTDNENRLIKDFKSICCNIGLIGYIIEGIDAFRDTGVVYLDVQPSKELITFRRDLRDRLRKYCNLSEWDFAEPFEFHTTIAMHQSPKTVGAIIKTIRHNREYRHWMLRATLLKNGKDTL
jgi:2'-5' RNA ligase